MDPLRIVVRVVFAYVLLLVLVRLGGKRLVKQASPFDFTLALIIGDMVDDLLWGEVDGSIFVTAVGVLFLIHAAVDFLRYRAGIVSWR
jgi:uncharacterized membrane protein YcaP (DUF421 family)